MVDEELKNYLISSLEKGINPDHLRKVLLDAGHDIENIEEALHHAHEHIDKDLIQYMEFELRKGHSLEKIKDDLLSIGHNFSRVDRVIAHMLRKYDKNAHKKDISRLMDYSISSALSIFKTKLFWVITIFFIAIICLAIFSIFYIGTPENNSALFSISKKKLDNACTTLPDLSGLCLSFLYDDVGYCANQSSQFSLCNEYHHFMNTVLKRGRYECDQISFGPFNELCIAVSVGSPDKCTSINNALYSSVCTAITTDNPYSCLSEDLNDDSQEICKGIYFTLDSDKKEDVTSCERVENSEMQKLCKLILLF